MVTTPDKITHTVDYFGEAPLGLASVYRLRVVTPERNQVLKIQAVMLADGTTEGDPATIGVVRAQRLGTALETERLKRLFATVQPSESSSDAEVADLTRKIGPPPTSSEKAIASLQDVQLLGRSVNDLTTATKAARVAFLVGVKTTREGALRSLEQLAQLPVVASAQQVAGGLSRTAFFSNLQRKYSDVAMKQAKELEVTR